jgi:hypothetical protein
MLAYSYFISTFVIFLSMGCLKLEEPFILKLENQK